MRGVDERKTAILDVLNEIGFFAEAVAKVSKTREDIKNWADLLDLDDYVTFGAKA